jgi:hypothetical protein
MGEQAEPEVAAARRKVGSEWRMSLREKVDITANVAVIGVAVLLSAALIKVFFLPPGSQTNSRLADATAVGTSMKDRIPGVDWKKNGRTLVLAISAQCHFCKESTPFYRKVQEEVKTLKTLAVLPQPADEAEQYLKDEGVRVDQVKQASLGDIGVQGTPTLLLVNSAGVVTNVWVGRLQPEREQQVLAALRKG